MQTPNDSHLDHCGALPYLTEMCGYSKSVFMTHPTKALAPILLEDYRRITVERRGESNFFTARMIADSLAKVIPLAINETFILHPKESAATSEGDPLILPPIEIMPLYAGHVLGAAMFYVRVGTQSVLYTGDYNMTPDRHLGAADTPLALRPDVLITESTYATTLRDSKRGRERDFLRNVHQCVTNDGGKVLIPVFALGRVQELCILLESYWERMGLSAIPIYFSAGMAETANEYYRIFVDWTNEKLQNDYPVRNMFNFKHIVQFERHLADNPGPMVLFSSPGMLHSGKLIDGVASRPQGCMHSRTGSRVRQECLWRSLESGAETRGTCSSFPAFASLARSAQRSSPGSAPSRWKTASPSPSACRCATCPLAPTPTPAASCR